MLRRWTGMAVVILAGLLAAGSAPFQCAAADREPLPTVPEAPEECYLLAQRLLAEGDAQGWRMALEYVVERFPGSRYAARAQDDLERGPLPTPAPGAEPAPTP